MRCSLLALSSYLDAELDSEPAGELEAHLLACDRCRTAIGYLREESERIAGLARVHLPDDAVHALFSQVGLIAEADELPPAPEFRDRPAPIEAPPWFGAERGQALPWAPRRSAPDPMLSGSPRELIGGRSPSTAVAEPPELFLWDEPIGQIDTASEPESPPAPARVPEPEPPPLHSSAPATADWTPPDDISVAPRPPEVVTSQEPQPPDLSTSAQIPARPALAHPPNAFHRIRDALAVRLALRRGGAHLDSHVEIVSGAGAPAWNERARPATWGESPPIVAMPEPEPEPALEPGPKPEAAPVSTPPAASHVASAPEPETAAPEPQPAAPTELADLLSEVAMLAAPLERPRASLPPEPEAPALEVDLGQPLEDMDAERPVVTVLPLDTPVVPTPPEPVRASAPEPRPGRHMRRLKAQKPERRHWDPSKPVTGRHVLPLGGPAVGAADRDRRLWAFGAATLAVMVVGLLIGRQVTQPSAHAPATVLRPKPTLQATTPVTQAPLPIATPLPAITVPPAPTAAQLTGVKNLGTGASGFSVADVRYGEHPNDFRMVFDLAFPDSVSGEPSTVIGFDGATTMYIEFSGVTGTAPIASPPSGQVVASVVPLPMARNSDRLVFKVTLSHKAPFDAYYLPGGRLIIDVT